MDSISLKQDFYKRFDDSDGYLKEERCGLLCTLLGFPNVKGAMSLTYPLSVGVKGVCRASFSDKISLENTSSDVAYTHRVNSVNGIIPIGKHLSGGQILLDNEIPPYINSDTEMKCCALKCVLSLNGYENYDKTAAAASCCGTDNIKPYLALLNAKTGYCIKSERLHTEALPLPLAGFKLILMQLAKPDSKKSDYKEIDRAADKLKTIYPHISSLSQLGIHQLEAAKHQIGNKLIYNRLCMIIRDNERIRAVSETLRSCRTSELFNMMNLSAKDFLRLWGPERQEAMLLRSALELEGVRAARFWNKGVAAVVYEERVDYILSSVEHLFKNTGEYEIKFCVAK